MMRRTTPKKALIPIAAAALVAVACGTRDTPDPDDAKTAPIIAPICDGMWAPVINGDRRMAGHGFSVLPPGGANWCLRYLGPHVFAFNKGTPPGEPIKSPTPEERAHTFVAYAYAVDFAGAKPDTPSALKAVVQRWLRNGTPQSCRRTPTGVRCTFPTAKTEDSARMKRVSSTVEPVEHAGAVCVRYRLRQEERENRHFPKLVLMIDQPLGLICRHPEVDGLYIVVAYSERYPQGAAPKPPLVESLKPEVERFVRSLTFAPVKS